jgi:DNA-binding NtrC family response regulator/tetratricopeptide (TPR) repeat protein
VPSYDRDRIVQLEERLALRPSIGETALADLEALADLYMQADSYVPALETIDRLLSLSGARTLSAAGRAALESKAISCRLARGDGQGALAQCRDLLGREDRLPTAALRARVRLQCSEALFRLGRVSECRDEAQRALALADQCGDLSLSACALNLLGRAAYREGDLKEARDAYEQALALYRRVGDEASSAHVRNNLGLIHKNLCEWAAAETHLTAALEIHRSQGRFAETANPLVNLGIVHQKRGHWARALECYAQAEKVYLQVGDHLRLVGVMIASGNIARLEHRFEAAAAALESALGRARELGARREEVLALEFLGELDHDRGLFAEACARYDRALGLARAIAPEGDLVTEIERRRAEALAGLGRLDEASAACEHARALASRIEDRLEHAVAHRVAGEIAAAGGRTAEAAEVLRTAVGLLVECRERFELARALLALGRVVPELTEARRLLYRASALFAELESTSWIERVEADLNRRFSTPVVPAPPAASGLGRRHRAPGLVACSLEMRQVEALARRAASTELSVLITGETGTGKELIARTIHSLSARAARPFLAVNCGAFRADLALSQLFGHRKGAFTGAHAEGVGLVEAAHGGTLFLDEVGELPLDVQVTLLRFLESGEYLRLGETQVRRSDVRLIAATNRELRGGEGERAFRRDLLFRLNEIEIRIPALRERADDLLPLARHFLAFYGGLEGPRLSSEAEAVLASHPWPGNVRELENVMKRVAALHAGDSMLGADALLPFLVHPAGAPAVGNGSGNGSGDLMERQAILAAFEQAGGNKSRVAEILGVSRKTLYARLKRLQMVLPS